jgi:hypothetical protein
MLTVKWVQRFAEDRPVEIEGSIFTDIDRVFALSKSELYGKHLRVLNPPDGFIICDENGHELRRWLSSTSGAAPPRTVRNLPTRRRERSATEGSRA